MNYGKYGVTRAELEPIIDDGIQNYDLSLEAIYSGLRMSLASAFNEHEYFSLDDVMAITGESREELLQRIEKCRQELLDDKPTCSAKIQGRLIYFRLFLLSRKASNAITKLPKAISKANIPMKIEMISKAVICATSPLMYSGKPGMKFWEVTTLQHDCSSLIFYHILSFMTIPRFPYKYYFPIFLFE